MSRETEIEKLTSSAKEALNETVDEIRDTILDRAILLAKKRQTADKEISLRDVIDAKEDLFGSRIIEKKKTYRQKRLYWLVSITGVFYALAGFLFYIIQNKDFSLENDFGLIIAGVGILVTLLSFMLMQIRKRETTFSSIDSSFESWANDDYDIVKRWGIIEKLTSEIMQDRGYSNNKSRSINSIVEFLSTELNDESIKNDLKILLETRNKILHKSYSLSKKKKKELTEKTNNIISILEEMAD